MTRVVASATATPSAAPAAASAPPCRSTIATMRRGPAPSAARIPISRRRCVTEYETTP